MAIRKRKKIHFMAKKKRKLRRAKLKAAGKNPDDYFYAGIYIGDITKKTQ